MDTYPSLFKDEQKMTCQHKCSFVLFNTYRFFFTSILLLLFLLTFWFSSSAVAKEDLLLSEEEKAWMDAHPEVIVGFVDDLPPTLIASENRQFTGMIPEIMSLLSQHTGIKFRFDIAPSWKEMLSRGFDRKTDIVPAIAAKSQYSKYSTHFKITHPYLKTRFYIFGNDRVQSKEYSLADLAGKKVGYIDSIKIVEHLAKQHPNIEFIPFDNRTSMVSSLVSDQISFVIHSGVFEYWRQQQRLISFKIVGMVPVLTTDIAMGVRKDWPALTSIINKFLSANEKEVESIIRHWLGYNKYTKELAHLPPRLTEQETLWIENNPIIRFSIDHSWAPIEFQGEKGEPHGISIQYLRHLEDILGLKFEFTPSLSWTDALNKLEHAQVDILPALSPNQARQQLFNFTAPYLSSPNGIFSAVDRAYLGGLPALRGKRVVVVEEYAIHKWLVENHPEIVLITVPSLEDALKQVASGEAYALIGNLITTSYYIGQTGLTQIKVVGEVDFNNELSIAVRKDWPILSSILQKGLETIPESKRTSIYNDWISIKYKHSVDYTILGAVISGATFIVLVILYWNQRLTSEVARRVSIEADLLEAKRETEKAAQAKSDFLRNMSHEIRTPLNAVISTGHLMHQTKLTEQQSEYMRVMQSSSETLLGIINNVLDFSKGESGKLRLDLASFSLKHLLKKIEDGLENQAMEKDLQLKLWVNADIPDQLIGDSLKLEQILLNLGSNAIKFSDHGKVDISVTKLDSALSNIALKFEVRDNGVGISEEQQKKLFQPFTQGDGSITRNFGGTGLGLVISQQLATLMQSEITIESQPGKGSCFAFVVQLEVCQNQEQIDRTPAEQPKAIDIVPELVNVKMLLVDDDAINLFLAKEFLRAFGARVESADSASQALTFLDREPFDIVLMDIQMPTMDGYEASRVIRLEEKWQQLPIIAMTAHTLEGERKKCMEAGMNDYLTKPIDPQELQDVLLKWVRPLRKNA